MHIAHLFCTYYTIVLYSDNKNLFCTKNLGKVVQTCSNSSFVLSMSSLFVDNGSTDKSLFLVERTKKGELRRNLGGSLNCKSAAAPCVCPTALQCSSQTFFRLAPRAASCRACTACTGCSTCTARSACCARRNCLFLSSSEKPGGLPAPVRACHPNYQNLRNRRLLIWLIMRLGVILSHLGEPSKGFLPIDILHKCHLCHLCHL